MATHNDKLVLNTIFNPFEPTAGLGDDSVKLDAEICLLENHPFELKCVKNLEKLKKLELEGVRLAEEGKLDESLDILNQVVDEAPNYASGYNNRAQVHQLKGSIEKALADLKKAIDLVDIDDCKCANKKKVLGQALCQRGLIYRFHWVMNSLNNKLLNLIRMRLCAIRCSIK